MKNFDEICKVEHELALRKNEEFEIYHFIIGLMDAVKFTKNVWKAKLIVL